MDTVLFCCILGGGLFKPLLVFCFRVEEKFPGGKFREIPFAVDIIFAGGNFRAKSKFAKIAKINSTRKIGVIQYILQINVVILTRQRRPRLVPLLCISNTLVNSDKQNSSLQNKSWLNYCLFSYKPDMHKHMAMAHRLPVNFKS